MWYALGINNITWSNDMPIETPQEASKRRQLFMSRLDKQVALFKEACDTPICGDDFPHSLYRVVAQGRNLIAGIQDMVAHAADLQKRLEAL